MIAPGATTVLARRSPIDAWYGSNAQGSRLREAMWLPERLNASVASGGAVKLTELSWRRRFGLKGPGAEPWLAARGFTMPATANSWQVTEDVWVGRLCTSEFLIEGLGAAQQRVLEAAQKLSAADRPQGVYPVARQDLVISLQGSALCEVLRQICSVDFAPLLAAAGRGGGALVLTSMMGVSVIAAPQLSADESELTLWIDPSFALYFWSTLLAVAAEFGGGVRIA